MIDNKEMPERVKLYYNSAEKCFELYRESAKTKELLGIECVEYIRVDEVESDAEMLAMKIAEIESEYEWEYKPSLADQTTMPHDKYVASRLIDFYYIIKKSGGSNNGKKPE